MRAAKSPKQKGEKLKPGRALLASDWSPTPLPEHPGLLGPVVSHIFADLHVSVSLWMSGRWWRPLHTESSIVNFEYEFGAYPRRVAYNDQCLRRAQREGNLVVGSLGGFQDAFVPLGGRTAPAGVLVAGPYARGRASAADLLSRWRRLSGSRGRLADGAFSSYVHATLATLTLDASEERSFARLMTCFAQVLVNHEDAAARAKEADALSYRLSRPRLPERMWEMARWLADERATHARVPLEHGDLAEFGLKKAPAHALVGLFRSRESAADPLVELLVRDEFQRAIAIRARELGGLLCGRVGEQGVMLLCEDKGSSARTKAALADLATRATAIARHFGLALHVGINDGREASLPVRYREALAAAEKALSSGAKIVYGVSKPESSGDVLRELRRDLGRSLRERPKLLSPRFNRYVETVLVHSGYRMEAAHAQLEAGLERLLESLLDNGFLDKNSSSAALRASERALQDSRTIADLVAVFRHLITDLERALEDPTGARQDRGMGRALSFMREHLGESLTLENVARAAGFAPDYFGRLFKRTEGTTFSKFLLELRIEQAKQMFESTTLSVEQVRALCGFKSRTHFHAIFKQATRLTPAEYRKASP